MPATVKSPPTFTFFVTPRPPATVIAPSAEEVDCEVEVIAIFSTLKVSPVRESCFHLNKLYYQIGKDHSIEVN